MNKQEKELRQAIRDAIIRDWDSPHNETEKRFFVVGNLDYPTSKTFKVDGASIEILRTKKIYWNSWALVRFDEFETVREAEQIGVNKILEARISELQFLADERRTAVEKRDKQLEQLLSALNELQNIATNSIIQLHRDALDILTTY